MKAQRGNQAIVVSVVAHNNFCSEVSRGGGTRVVHGPLSKFFISPVKSNSLSSACEGDFLRGASISSRDILLVNIRPVKEYQHGHSKL